MLDSALMLSTHMAWGFVFAYLLAFLFVIFVPSSYPAIVSATAYLAIAGILGGGFPDVDGWESRGFVHRNSCHYIIGYLFATLILVAVAVVFPQYRFWMALFACFTLGAWGHSVMDLADGGRNNGLSQGVYEHVFLKRWLPAHNWIPFARMYEWVLQAFAALWFIPISANLSQLVVSVPNWLLGMFAYAVIWAVSLWYDINHQVREMRRV
jgi:hypothetical protein